MNGKCHRYGELLTRYVFLPCGVGSVLDAGLGDRVAFSTTVCTCYEPRGLVGDMWCELATETDLHGYYVCNVLGAGREPILTCTLNS